MFGAADFKKRVDAPPKDAFFAFDSGCHVGRLGYGIILAGESTDQHVEFRYVSFVILDLLNDFRKVFVYAATFAETLLVASPCELFGGSSVWLPVIGPNCMEIAGWLFVELGMFRVVVAVESETEASYAGEKFGDSDFLAHCNPYIPYDPNDRSILSKLIFYRPSGID